VRATVSREAVDLVEPHTEVFIYIATLHLYDLEMISKFWVATFMNGNSPAHIIVLRIYPGLQASNLNVAAVDLLLGTFNLEIHFCCLPVCKDGPIFGE